MAVRRRGVLWGSQPYLVTLRPIGANHKALLEGGDWGAGLQADHVPPAHGSLRPHVARTNHEDPAHPVLKHLAPAFKDYFVTRSQPVQVVEEQPAVGPGVAQADSKKMQISHATNKGLPDTNKRGLG